MKIDKTPEPHYFKHGYIQFNKSKDDGELRYSVIMWLDDDIGGDLKTHSELIKGKVKDENHLKQLQSCKMLVEIQELQNTEEAK